MTSDQELFAKGLATYRKVITAKYMAHEQVHNLLHEILLDDANDGFVFADLACGTAPFSAGTLSGTCVSRYIVIDISKPSRRPNPQIDYAGPITVAFEAPSAGR